MKESFQVETLQPHDVQSNFVCGQKDLERYFRKHALNNDLLGIGKTFVIRGYKKNHPKVVGFYVLSMASVQSPQVSKVIQKKLPRYPMPVVLPR